MLTLLLVEERTRVGVKAKTIGPENISQYIRESKDYETYIESAIATLQMDMTFDDVLKRIADIQKELPKKIVANFAKAVKKNAITNISNKILHIRTGHLRRYLLARGLEFADGDMTAVWGAKVESGEEGTESKIAKIQEVGGTITPKNTQFLRVPLPPALTANGVDRMLGMKLREQRDLGFFVPRGERTNPILFRRIGKNIEPWYVLKRSVTIKPKYWLKEAINEVSMPSVFRQAEREVENKE